MRTLKNVAISRICRAKHNQHVFHVYYLYTKNKLYRKVRSSAHFCNVLNFTAGRWWWTRWSSIQHAYMYRGIDEKPARKSVAALLLRFIVVGYLLPICIVGNIYLPIGKWVSQTVWCWRWQKFNISVVLTCAFMRYMCVAVVDGNRLIGSLIKCGRYNQVGLVLMRRCDYSCRSC